MTSKKTQLWGAQGMISASMISADSNHASSSSSSWGLQAPPFNNVNVTKTKSTKSGKRRYVQPVNDEDNDDDDLELPNKGSFVGSDDDVDADSDNKDFLLFAGLKNSPNTIPTRKRKRRVGLPKASQIKRQTTAASSSSAVLRRGSNPTSIPDTSITLPPSLSVSSTTVPPLATPAAKTIQTPVATPPTPTTSTPRESLSNRFSTPSSTSISTPTTLTRNSSSSSASSTSSVPSSWKWMGSPMESPTFCGEAITNPRQTYYEQVECSAGFVLSLGDGVLLRSDESALPYVARIRGFYQDNLVESQKTVIIEWFFRPEELKNGRESTHGKDEVVMKKVGIQVRGYSLNCIDCPCDIFTYPEYCRHRAKEAKAKQTNATQQPAWPAFFVKLWYDNEDNYKSVRRKRVPGRIKQSHQIALDNSVNNFLNINKRNTKGETKLHSACIKGNANDVRHLIRMGAQTELTDNAGWTPLHEACAHNHVEVARLLIRSRVDVNYPGPNGVLPIHDAIENENVDLVRLLIRSQANLDARDSQGRLPIDLVSRDNEDIRSLLVYGGDGPVRERRAAAVACDEMNSVISQF